MLDNKKREKGFTIIEVMIVLAIAGMILLIVFLAVPALQRNSRNTQRKNDVQNLLAAVSTFQDNNAGKIPNVNDLKNGDWNPGYYPVSNLTVTSGNQGSVTSDTIRLVTGAKCELSGGVPTGKTVIGAARQFSVQYMIEEASGLKPTCQVS